MKCFLNTLKYYINDKYYSTINITALSFSISITTADHAAHSEQTKCSTFKLGGGPLELNFNGWHGLLFLCLVFRNTVIMIVALLSGRKVKFIYSGALLNDCFI